MIAQRAIACILWIEFASIKLSQTVPHLPAECITSDAVICCKSRLRDLLNAYRAWKAHTSPVCCLKAFCYIGSLSQTLISAFWEAAVLAAIESAGWLDSQSDSSELTSSDWAFSTRCSNDVPARKCIVQPYVLYGNNLSGATKRKPLTIVNNHHKFLWCWKMVA